MNFFIASIPFFVLSLIHLIQGLLEKHKAANFTKILLMPSLILAILISGVFKNQFGLFVICALIFATLGDKFLIKPVSKTNFLKGVLSFFLGHIFLLICVIPISKIWILPSWIIAIFIMIYGTIIFGSYNILGKPKGFRGFAAVVYTAMLTLMGLVCFSTLLINRNFQSLIIFLGSLSFMISDSVLGITLFKSEFPKSRFVIMSTYLTAEFLLTYGILM
jgi:uncharacterized membrane protein YhhN